MSHRSRLYKRTHTTEQRKLDQENLIASNLIGLGLTDKFDLIKSRRNNEEYRRPQDLGIREEDEAFDKYTPVSAVYNTRLPATPCTSYNRNFAVFKPVVNYANGVFVHGKELFSQPAAERYYANGFDPGTFPYADFGEAAKEKIRHLLQPEGLIARLFDYGSPDTKEEALAQWIEELRQQHPHIPFPDTKEITVKTRSAVNRKVDILLEKHGIKQSAHEEGRFKSDAEIAEAKTELKPYTFQKIQRDLAQLEKEGHGEAVATHYTALLKILETLDYDPEIVEHFKIGVQSMADAASQSLQKIIDTGLEKRMEAIIRSMAAEISNPYDPKFIGAEKDVADMLVHSINPRVLNNIIKRRSPFLITNHGDISPFNDISQSDGERSQGMYATRSPESATNLADITYISARNLNYADFAITARHESGHYRDISLKFPFGRNDRIELDRKIKKDAVHLAEVQAFLRKLDSDNLSDSQFFRLQRLANAFSPEVVKTEPGNNWPIGFLVGDMEEAIENVKRNLQYSRPLAKKEKEDDEKRGGYTPTAPIRQAELAAAIEEFRGVYGPAFVKELLPHTHDAFIRHRLQDERLQLGHSR